MKENNYFTKLSLSSIDLFSTKVKIMLWKLCRQLKGTIGKK